MIGPDSTLQALDDAGLDLRLWCYRCARAAVVDSIIWQRFERNGWPTDLPAARSRFRCKECRSSGDILIVPTKRPPPPANAAEQLVAGIFHFWRGQSKKQPR